VHSIAFSPKDALQGRVVDVSREGFLTTMDVSCWTFIDTMLEKTDSKHAPWYIVHSNDKRRARLNCISQILRSIPYKKIQRTTVKLPKRSDKGKYDDQATLSGRNFVRETY
jgi:polyphosphate kinase 2 PPK2